MKVLQACPYDWHAPGGVQMHVRQLASHLASRGHEVRVVAPGDRPAVEPWVQIVGRPVGVRFNGSRVPVCFGPRVALAVRRALRDFVPDIVHVHEHLSPSVGMFATALADAPVVATFHASYQPSMSSLVYRLEALLLWRLSRRVTDGIAVSHAAAATIRSRATIRLQIVPNGVDLDRFSVRRGPGRARKTMLFVGRLEPRKGFEDAVLAFEALACGSPNLDLHVVGTGPAQDAIRHLAPSLRERVTMFGAVSDDNLPRHYAAADLFVAPSTGRESFGVVLLEAMASGLPIVTSDIDGYREVVRHEREGLLVPPSDPLAVADAVLRLIGDDVLARRLGDAGRIRARDYAWTRVAREVEAIYIAALGPRLALTVPLGESFAPPHPRARFEVDPPSTPS
jgi:phosphatidyl-myo-inositol alpha-mannosyltransferase